MSTRSWLTWMVAGMGGAVIVILAGLLWNSGSNGGLVRLLGGVGSSTSPKWETFANKNGYNVACDYRIHLLIPPEKATKISIDLSRYTGDSSFIYPTVVNNRFLQAIIMAPGNPIAVDLSDKESGGCDPGQAGLSNLPGMCFDTKIEQRC